MSKIMTPQPQALRDIMVNPQIEKPQTNYDLLISKTPEEMAEWLSEVAGWISPYEGRVHPLLDWLKAPVEVDNG